MQEQLGFKNFRFFDVKKSTQAFVAGNDKNIIISFRGTEKKVKDFLADAKLKMKDGPEVKNGFLGKVHHGFRDGLKEVWDNGIENKDMPPYIKQCRDNNQSIWFCGHSLGAALATLAAAEYVLNKGDTLDREVVKGIYTIGQPRVGNREFAIGFDAVLSEKCFRIVNNNDLVPQIPAPGILLKYAHVGQELYIDSEGKMQGSISLWKKLMDQFRGIQDDVGEKGLDKLADHRAAGYVSLIKANRNINPMA